MVVEDYLNDDAAVARANSRRALNEEAALVDNAAVDMELGDEDQTVIMHVLVLGLK